MIENIIQNYVLGVLSWCWISQGIWILSTQVTIVLKRVKESSYSSLICSSFLGSSLLPPIERNTPDKSDQHGCSPMNKKYSVILDGRYTCAMLLISFLNFGSLYFSKIQNYISINYRNLIKYKFWDKFLRIGEFYLKP